MKTLLTVAAIIVGCASPATLAQTTPDEILDKVAAKETSASVETRVAATETITTPCSFECDARRPSSVESEQDSLKDRIGSTKFVAPKIESLDLINDTASEKDSLTKKQDQSSSSSGWHFGFSPYLFAAGISGTVGARGRTLDLDADFSG
ncbi:MAG TPA: hypothetical protein VJV05_08980, partial [Pyrinomonadaceae bacterium]|nr:hypothetical protein [Pyrinomonadaceae bacterium]